MDASSDRRSNRRTESTVVTSQSSTENENQSVGIEASATAVGGEEVSAAEAPEDGPPPDVTTSAAGETGSEGEPVASDEAEHPRWPPLPPRIGAFDLESELTEVVGGVRVEAVGAPETEEAGKRVTITLAPIAGTVSATVASLGDKLSMGHFPGLMPVVGAGHAGDWNYVIQFPLPVDTLAIRRSGGPLPPPQVEATIIGLSGVLSRLHALGVAHGDIRAANIALDADQNVVLGGIVPAEGPVTFVAPDLQSLVAPERWTNPPSMAADQYALAVTIVSLLTNVPTRSIGGDRLSTLDLGLPVPMVTVIGRALSAAPEDRYPDVAAFVGAYRHAVDAGADGLAAGVADALASRDVNMARLLIEGALRFRPHHATALMLQSQMQTTLMMGMIGTPMAPVPLSPPGGPMASFDLAVVAPPPVTRSGSSPWVTVGIVILIGVIVLAIGIAVVVYLISRQGVSGG